MKSTITYLAIALVFIVGVFQWGKLSERQNWLSMGDRTTIELQDNELQARAADDLLRMEQEQRLGEFRFATQEAYHALQDPTRACFVGPDADRLRELWR